MFGRRSNGPMNARRFLGLALNNWPEFVARPLCHASFPTPSQTRWRRPEEERPRLGFAEAGILTHSPFGRKGPRAQRTGAGRGQGHLRSWTASPRPACAAPPGPGPIPSLPGLLSV